MCVQHVNKWLIVEKWRLDSSETKVEDRLLGLVILADLFQCCSRVEILQLPPPAPSGSESPGIPWCTISTKAFPYPSCSHWLYLFKSNLTDHFLNSIFSNRTRSIVFRCGKYGEAVYIMFFNSTRERDLAGDSMGHNHAGEAL